MNYVATCIDGRRLAAALVIGTLVLASGCSPLRRVQRRDPLSRVVVGGNYVRDSESDGSESSGWLAKIAYVPGAVTARDGIGWRWRPGISAQQWEIDDSGESPEVLFRDVELFVRQPDLLCRQPAGAQRFRLAAQVGTFWSDYKVDGLRASNNLTPGSTRWRTIPLLAWRGTIEPEVLVAFGESWELSAFASVHGAAGAAHPSNGGGDTSDAVYDLTSMTDFGYEVGMRTAIGPITAQISFQSRQLRGGSSSADPDEATGTPYDPLDSQTSTIEGVWLLFGVAF